MARQFRNVSVALACGEAAATLKYGPGGYVQDGLVAHFDGICNAGEGRVHDMFATNWGELSANRNDAFLVNDAASAGRWHAAKRLAPHPGREGHGASSQMVVGQGFEPWKA